MTATKIQKEKLENFWLDPVSYIHQHRAYDLFFIDNTYELLSLLERPSDPDLNRILQSCKDRKRQTVEPLLNHIAETALLRLTAHRGDWLYVENHIVFSLNALAWVALLVDERFAVPDGDREACLRAFCQRFDGTRQLDALLAPTSLKAWGDTLIALVLDAAQYLRDAWGHFELGAAGMLQDFQKDPERIRWWPPEIATEAEKQAALDRVVAALGRLPVYLGTLLYGSSADDAKRDPWGDLDLHCLCTDLPDEAMRQSLIKNLAPKSETGFACFQFLGLDQKITCDLCFVSRDNQETYLRGLEEDGRADAQTNFAQLDFAVPAYNWSRARILSDPDGVLADFQRRGQSFPAACRRAEQAKWTPLWQRYAAAFAPAWQKGDRVRAWTALHLSNVAALHLALAHHRLHANPLEPKWFPQEIQQHLARHPELTPVLGDLPADVTAPLPTRFATIEAIHTRTP